MKEIKLYNRDGADLKLVSEDGNLWKIKKANLLIPVEALCYHVVKQ